MADNDPSHLRLAALERTGLLDSPADDGFDRLTRLAVTMLGVPVALVSLVDRERQFFKSAVGLPEPWATARETPLSHSFCQHVVQSAAPLVISDAREHPLVCSNPAIRDLGVIAYAGIPLVTPDGMVMGSFCVIDVKPRQWSEKDLDILTDLAASVTTAIHLKLAKDAAEAANRAKERFLAVLSHELRTPISPVLMIAGNQADDETLPASVREDARTIRRNVTQQTRLIDDLLDFTRIENGKLSLQLAPLDLHELLAEVITLCRAEADAKHIAVSIQARAGRSNVRGDSGRLRQVFCNLLKNAVKFTPVGGSVEITTSNTVDGDISVAVSDNGIGVEPALLPTIFNVFEQGGRAITDEFSGLGLGLAISKGMVEAQGGTISALSQGRGKGTTLTVQLPVLPHNAPAAVVTETKSQIRKPRLSILLVEDHLDTLRIMARLLKQQQHRVTTADSVKTALAAAENQKFDLLISDLGLPDGSGLDLMREMQKTQPITGIALTGYGMESDLENTRLAGFKHHLTKPIDFSQLDQMLEDGAGQ